MKKKLVLFGLEDFAQIAYEYFMHDSDYEVVGFTADRAYINAPQLFGLPVVPFDEVEKHFAPHEHSMHVAIIYGRMNRIRQEIAARAKAKGYALASYISSRAFIWKNVQIGEHCFIFEDNTIQPFVKIGDNVIMWSGNHIGHHSTIGSHNFISSHVVVSGWCGIGEHCFLGVNATLANNTHLGAGSWVMHSAVLGGNVPEKSMVKSTKSEITPLDEDALFRALTRAAALRG